MCGCGGGVKTMTVSYDTWFMMAADMSEMVNEVMISEEGICSLVMVV